MTDQPTSKAPTPVDRLVTLYEQGDIQAVLHEGSALAREMPSDPFIPYLLGLAHAAAGELDAAAASYQRSIELNPRSPAAHSNLGGILERLGKSREAVASYRRALELKPDAKTCTNLGACLLDLGMTEAAVSRFRQALGLDPTLAEAHNNLGHALDTLRRPAEAAASCRMALQLKPDYAEAHNNLGNALLHLGKPEQARASYESALKCHPDYAEAHRNLSALKDYEQDDAQFARMTRLLESTDLPDRDRMLLNFALGKAYGDLTRYDQAFACLAEGNRLRRQQVDFDMASARQTFEQIQSTFSGELPGLGTDEDPVDGIQDSQVIFILGMPRSGTSLAEQILASHSQVVGAGELKLLDQAVGQIDREAQAVSTESLRSLRRHYLSGLAGLTPSGSLITDKMPFNFLWIGFICQALPGARIVHMNRDARAILWSNFKQLFSDPRTGFTNDLGDLAEYLLIYARLMRFWRDRYPGRIFELSYESLVANQEAETRKLLDFVGLEWEPQCLEYHRTERPVMTASAAQVRKRIYTDSQEEWRHYQQQLEPVLERLKDS